MTAIASFFNVKIHLPGVSAELTASDSDHFDDIKASTDTTKFGYYVQNIFEMKNASGAFTTRERGLYGIHYVNSTSGELDTTWTSADFAAVETALQAMWSTNAGFFPDSCRLVEHRWYPFGPGVVEPNPAYRVTTLGTPKVGTSTATWIRQVATTATFRTALRRHWGRIYLPLSLVSYSSTGQMTSGDAAAILAFVRTALTGAEASQGVVPVVYDRNRKVAMTIRSYEVDSVPDIQRRRRPRDTAFRSVAVS
jgi:hypothetical protein